MIFNPIDQKCISAIRALVIDAVEQAQSGHVGLPLGSAPMAYVLWTRFLKHQPEKPAWYNRDRFILSAGHGSMLLYALLHLSGYGLSVEELQRFRQMGSRTPGHPEFRVTPGVEATTGPLGQGLAMAVGMAAAERFMAGKFNRPQFDIFNHFTYVLCGDGDLMEGVASEAASLAGHLQLGKLVVLYDSNGISQDGPTAQSFTENVRARFQGYGWQYLSVADGNDISAIEAAIQKAQSEKERPSLIEVHTIIGYGSPEKQGTSAAHSGPLGKTESAAAKAAYHWDFPPFVVPESVYAHFAQLRENWRNQEKQWQDNLSKYRREYPDDGNLLDKVMAQKTPVDWDLIGSDMETDMSGRDAFSSIMQRLATQLPTLVGGSADLASSNRTWLQQEPPFAAPAYEGRNFCYGVREHAMGAMLNGMALHGGMIPFAGTFLVFSDYMKPAIRMASLMSLKVVYAFTHDSLMVGEDGPTHEPVEQLTALRSIPGLYVFRPADSTEVFYCAKYAFSRSGPSALALSRQTLPYLQEIKNHQEKIQRGGYVVWDSDDEDPLNLPELILMASGSELCMALAAAKAIAAKGFRVRVASMPCLELFDAQDTHYRDSILPPSVENRLAIEMAAPMPWYKYVGLKGKIVGVNEFGKSGNGAAVAESYGFNVENVTAIAEKLLTAR